MHIVKIIILVIFTKNHVDVLADIDAEDAKEAHNATRLADYLKEHKIRCHAISAYEGSVARLPCGGAREQQKVTWLYAESIYNVTFSPMEEKETAVEDGNLTIYYVQQSDRGVYQCNVGSIVSSLVVLQVLDDDDKYNVVKPLTSHGPYPSPPARLSSKLLVFIRWSAWSGCSRCGQVGRQRRYGYCCVRYTDTSGSNVKYNSSESNNVLLRNEDIKLFQAFPDGIPCKSNLLPVTIIDLPAVATRNNEIMIGLCKVPCKSDIFEVRASNGEVLERANNSEGVFSLCQREPPQPPPPSRDMHFAPRGAAVLLKCPGSALEDRPVTWWIGNREVVPRELDISTAGRMHLNARDHIVIVSAEYTDSNVYSCWEGEKLSGVIKLKLFSESREKCGGRVTQLGVVCGLALLHRALHHLHLCLTRVTPRTPLTPSHAR
ncbi:PREDICTED: uncharacterized protein LOC106114241 isoform X1 [Papilio xuthus]|uniref:Uncharacterized protein LOC106114241 isoform X1 n=1 Tax=Papilio xuthus TaxID=66420 RepID=A0AAJ6Z0Q2_PAPXU|nr:PREDICTED: uncharacterized protein LOC106114241 isoform X1 [Papilio xuthus]